MVNRVMTIIKMKIALTFSLLIAEVCFYSCRNNTNAGNTTKDSTLSISDTSIDWDVSQNKQVELVERPPILGEQIALDEKYTILDCPDILQNNDYTCGVWAGLTVLGYYGISEYADTLAKQMNTNSESGTEMEDIARVLKSYGLKTNMRQMTIEELKAFIKNKMPVIVMMQSYNPSGRYQKGNSLNNAEWGHYVTVVGYGGGNIVFKDPDALGKMFLSEKQFLTRWKGIDEYQKREAKILNRYGIVVFGKKPQFGKTLKTLKKMP